ncbi:arsenate reductase family protein [Boseongicola aestuarii]|uniref:Regulatory protein Spx n=1 Tax=Boseongicola aestuarii TaxID=1470561 RepID=A0A238IW55_9RHOB|nr:ArsC/Spx/MgsR family protein [Boseongicola aestuarii]SMX22657.1 Regulatory protein Spx [Boseongicola aestuarii]
MAVLYGIASCDTCRKARKSLENSGLGVEFRDVRAAPLSGDEIARFLAEFGGSLLNTRSTTWRGLSESERGGAPETLIAAHPTLMKRPVIEGPGGLTLGWDKAAQAAHLG